MDQHVNTSTTIKIRPFIFFRGDNAFENAVRKISANLFRDQCSECTTTLATGQNYRHDLAVDIWGLCCQMQVSQAGISNYIPQFTVGCNYLSLPEIPASWHKVHLCRADNHSPTGPYTVLRAMAWPANWDMEQTNLALNKEDKLVEQVKDLTGWLMDGSKDGTTFSCHLLQGVDDLTRNGWIQSWSGFLCGR